MQAFNECYEFRSHVLTISGHVMPLFPLLIELFFSLNLSFQKFFLHQLDLNQRTPKEK